MAGRGVAPKPSDKRARRNVDPIGTRTLDLIRAAAPDLPDGVDWHLQTRAWWDIWSRSELAKDFTESDWSFLLDTALMHHAMWSKGQWTLAAEVRLRVAKYGATPEDRARLRIVFADADAKDDRRKPPANSRKRYGKLTAVGA
jgi:hypothetical protein